MQGFTFRCLIALLILAAAPAMAADRKSKASEKTSASAADESGRDASSAANRKRLRASVLAEMGFVEFPQFGYGARGVFVQSSRLNYELAYAQSKFEFLGLGYESQVVSARAKWFPGNSFYLTGGLTHRSLQARLDSFVLTDAGLKTKPDVSYSRDSLMADLALGNQWQFSGFTIGCDWAGLLIPVATLSEDKADVASERRVTGAALADSDDDKNVESFRKNADETRLQLVRFYLGWSF